MFVFAVTVMPRVVTIIIADILFIILIRFVWEVCLSYACMESFHNVAGGVISFYKDRTNSCTAAKKGAPVPHRTINSLLYDSRWRRRCHCGLVDPSRCTVKRVDQRHMAARADPQGEKKKSLF